MSSSPSVVVIGGGVAGLTAAHELAERGFRVDVYEARPAWGGKARSQPVAATATAGRRELPGEHGFRFYPRFYRHVIDTMRRIPRPGGGVVADELRATTEAAIALIDNTTWFRFFHRSIAKPYDIVSALELFFADLGFDNADVGMFGAKILQFFTSSGQRRVGEYEQMSWWEFLEARACSAQFQRQLRAVPRMMVAMDAQRGSANTVGTISMQLLLDYATTGVNNDRTLAGPTTELWIEPWLAHLEQLHVGLHAGAVAVRLDVNGDHIAGVALADGSRVTADYYVLAVPIEAAIPLLSPELAALDPQLAVLAHKKPDELVSWMSGIQFYLYEDVPIVRGHVFYPDSPWALTSISQAQFWRDRGLFRKRYGDGETGGCLSVDISEWDTPGTFVPKRAKDCTPAEIEREVWCQLKAALNGSHEGEQILSDDLKHSWHLDDDLEFVAAGGIVNHSRLLVHPPGSWQYRPSAGTALPNLVLAADYVRTQTNIASMEGANEAARLAVNVIVQRSGSSANACALWPLVEPERFDAWKALDRRLYEHGKKHLFELMGIRQAAQAMDVLRRFSAFTGLAKLDELLDEVKASSIIRGLLDRLGVS